MSTTPKKKLCWNCEGRVSLKETNCPYCAVYLGPAPDEEEVAEVHAPPYSMNSQEEAEEVPASPYLQEAVKSEDELEQVEAQGDIKAIVMPLTALSGGALLLVFALMLLFFSSNGTFVLKWDASYWYLYLLFGLPLLVVGWLMLPTEIEED